MHFRHKFITSQYKLVDNFIRFIHLKTKKINNGILLNGVLIPKLLNKPFVSCYFTNLDFLDPNSAYFDYIINLPFFVLKIFEFKFSVFFLRFKQ